MMMTTEDETVQKQQNIRKLKVVVSSGKQPVKPSLCHSKIGMLPIKTPRTMQNVMIISL